MFFYTSAAASQQAKVKGDAIHRQAVFSF